MTAIARLGDPITCGDVLDQGSGNVWSNGLPVSRVGVDNTAGHCFNPTPVMSGSPDVFANNINVDRVDDPIISHCCKDDCHSGTVANGSPDVYVNDGGGASSITMDDDTANFNIDQNAADKQDSASAYDAATTDVDDEGAPSDTGGSSPQSTGNVPFSRKQTYVAAAAHHDNVDISTQPQLSDSAAVTHTPVPPSTNYNYNDILNATSLPPSFKLSPNFTLGMLTNQARISRYQLQNQQTNGRMYSEKDIACNLRDLCYNILEPLKQMYPNIIVNSGFRHASNGRSQHERGQAADMALTTTDHDSNAAWTVAQAIANSKLPYDQFIFEQNNSIWFHLSFDRQRSSQRGMLMSKPRGLDKPTQGLRKI